MQIDTINYLIELNRQFYQTFGSQFSATRQRLQPGVRRILERVPENANLLDLGCGNGELWRSLIDSGFRGHYTGLDFSAALLDIAKGDIQSHLGKATFIQADLTEEGWDAKIPNTPVDLVFAFSVLHHLPGESTHLKILETVKGLLKAGGQFIHSEWQFLNSERLKARIQPWEKVNLDEAQLDQGDYLLDWKHGGYGLRYVHHFSEEELQNLAVDSGFEIVETFLSDGENGRLGLYQIWEKK